MLEDEFLKLSRKIFDILGDETDFNLSDKDIPLEDGGFFFAFGSTYNLDISKPISDDSDYTATTYFDFQLNGHKERLLTYRRKGSFNRTEITLMDFEKRIELAKKHPFISTHAFNRLIDLLDSYPETIRGSLRLNAD
ncbi:hypothetical protein FOI42_RS03890 [Escherichia coli]|nr:hypothetical protein [Escherichia coli]MED6699451.1 hypothetical protein [Escherichia coli O157]USL83564.1 hypothetical protein A4_488 [Escherichia phage A4]HCQ0858541.1 hypothetical protein [Escherichia coli]